MPENNGKKPTIDERLEALTQTVELMAAVQREGIQRHEALNQTVEIIAGMQRKNETLLAEVIESINSLARIAQAHERRLDRLEGEPPR